MKPQVFCFRRGRLIGISILVVVVQSLTEFVDSSLLHSLGMPYGGFEIHLSQVIITTIITLPVFVLWFHDFANLRNAEVHRQEEREDFQSLFEYNPNMIALYATDGRCLDANPAFLRYVELSIDQVKSADPFLVIDKKYGCTLLDCFELASHGVPQHVVTQQLLHTGQSVDLDVTFFPVYRNQVPTGVYAIARDVTKERATERELTEAQAIINAFIQHTTDAISIVDTTGKTLLVNPAWEALYGWTMKDILGQVIPSPDFDLIQSVISTLTPVSKHLSVVTRLGTWVPVSLSAAPILAADGQLLGVSFITKNMTRYKETEEFIRRSEKLAVSGELAAGLAHEIRNPLTAIRGFLQLMKDNPDDRYLDILLMEVDRINTITNELLLLAKPQASIFEDIDVAAMIHDVLLLMKSQANMHGVIITENVQLDLPLIHGVKNQLKQVIINIVKNAIEAQPGGGYVSVSAERKIDWVTMAIADGGPGMSSQTLAKLGQPFYTTKGRGSGLGLMVSYRIIQNHHGEIKVESEPGKGSRFLVSLPLIEVPLK